MNLFRWNDVTFIAERWARANAWARGSTSICVIVLVRDDRSVDFVL